MLFVALRIYWPKVSIQAGAVAVVALALQAGAIFVPLGADDVPKKLLFQTSYLLLIFFVAANWRRIGILIIGVGLLLNFAAIISNGGLMPVTPEAYARIGESQKVEGLEPGDAITNQKEILKSRETTHLYFLTDRIVRDNPVVPIFSIGDIIAAVGLIVTLADLLLPRVTRVPRDGGPAEAKPPGGGTSRGAA